MHIGLNTHLQTLSTRVQEVADGVATLDTSALDALATAANIHLQTINSTLGDTNGHLMEIDTEMTNANATLTSMDSRITDTNAKVDAANALLTSMDTKLDSSTDLTNLELYQQETNTNLLNIEAGLAGIAQLPTKNDTIQSKIAEGKCHMASATALASNGEICYLSNPLLSGKNVVLSRITIQGSWGIRRVILHESDVVLTGGSTPHRVNGAFASIAEYGTGSTNSGTDTTIFECWSGQGTTMELLDQEYITISEGTSIYFEAANGADNARSTVTMYWYEE